MSARSRRPTTFPPGSRAQTIVLSMSTAFDTALQAFPDLRALLDRHRPGETLRLVYLRDGLDHATSVTLGSRP